MNELPLLALIAAPPPSSPRRTVILRAFDNGVQFGYDSAEIGIWTPYTDQDGTRYANAWTVWDNIWADCPRLVPDPTYTGLGSRHLAARHLGVAIALAEAHFGIHIELRGTDWKKEYPALAKYAMPSLGQRQRGGVQWRRRRGRCADDAPTV